MSKTSSEAGERAYTQLLEDHLIESRLRSGLRDNVGDLVRVFVDEFD